MHFYCFECDKKIDIGSEKAFIQFHICKNHGITAKDYYDKYKKTNNDGICDWCESQTKFISYNKGYHKTCSAECGRKAKPKSKEYFDRYIKKEYDGICLKCKNQTTWFSSYGHYAKYCSNKCQMSDERNLNKRKETCKSKFDNETYLRSKTYEKTMIENFGSTHPHQVDELRRKIINTWILKYNTTNPMKNRDVVERMKTNQNTSNIEKYGVSNIFESDVFRVLMERSGYWLKHEAVSEYRKYWLLVQRETRKHKQRVIDESNNRCFYTKILLVSNDEYLLQHPGIHTSKNMYQPVIDHKKSIFWGFTNGIPIDVIGGYDNLCITSRVLNSEKNKMNDFEFIQKIKSVMEVGCGNP